MPKVNVKISIENEAASKPKSKSAFILLDRSGSMSRHWDETMGAMNAYVTELAADETSRDTRVTLALFDTPGSDMDFRVLRRSEQAGSWKCVSPHEAMPRGYTPLYDAIGRIVALAEEDRSERTVIVVITDGAENRSREITRGEAKDALDRCRAKGWQVVFIGAEFDAFSQAASVGGLRGQTVSMAAGNYTASTQSLARKTRAYNNLQGSGAEFAVAASATMSFTDEDRAEYAGKKREGA